MSTVNRRQFLSAATASAALALATPSWATTRNSRLTLNLDKTIAQVPEDFMGLSYESSQLAHPGYFSAANVNLVSFLRTLGATGVLRLGGNMREFVSWSPVDPPANYVDSTESESPDAGNGSTHAFTVTPRAIRNLNEFLQATNWKLIYGLNLEQGTASAVADEAAFVAKICGPRLLAFQFGNEPDLFTHNDNPKDHWQYAEYMARWKEFEEAVRARVPNASFAGPDTSYRTEWIADFANDTKGKAPLLTSHYYAEGPPTDPRMTIDYLLTQQTQFNKEVQSAIGFSRTAGLPFRITESNSCYNAGKKGVSDTFASSLWVGDLLAQIASAGVTGMNLHGGGNGLYTPIAGSQKSGFNARPVYYGMLMARVLAGSTMMQSDLDTGGINLTAYAMQKQSEIVVLAFNKDSKPTTLSIQMPAGDPKRTRNASVMRLRAPFIDAASGVELGGSSVTSDGCWKPSSTETIQSTQRTLEVKLPAYSAASISFESNADATHTVGHRKNDLPVAGKARMLNRLAGVILLGALAVSLSCAAQHAQPASEKSTTTISTDALPSFYNGSKEWDLYVEVTPWQNEQARRGEYQWEPYATRVIEQLKGYKPVAIKQDKYGGRLDITEKATGFYHVAKIGGRWWNIDPEGHAYTNIAVAGVTPGPSPNEQKVLKETFGDEAGWMKFTHALLVRSGFNSLGAWGNIADLHNSPYQSVRPLSYTVILNFTYEYAAKNRKYKNTGYPGGWMRGAIPVFDPEFADVVDVMAKNVEKYKDDANLYGYFIDNELPFQRSNLDTYLAMPKDDPGYKAAKAWMDAHHAVLSNDKLRAEFLGYEADLYFRITSSALRKHDPNHMVLGSRFTEPEYRLPELFEAAGKYCDVISVNFYTHWTPPSDAMVMWEAAAKKPFLITEFYTKAVDSGMANVTGAGWLVHTQADRGAAYQNVTLQLLENKGNVGWQFFRYQDNDPTDTANKWDDSNIDGNKGIVDSKYRIWQQLLDRQKQVNLNAYSLIDYFDTRKK